MAKISSKVSFGNLTMMCSYKQSGILDLGHHPHLDDRYFKDQSERQDQHKSIPRKRSLKSTQKAQKIQTTQNKEQTLEKMLVKESNRITKLFH